MVVNVPLESQRCAILCVSHNHAVQGNLDVRALNRALTENQSFIKVKAAIFYYFHSFTEPSTYQFILTNNMFNSTALHHPMQSYAS